jgi:hypothetical protein
MLAQLDRAANYELYGAEAKKAETCSRALGGLSRQVGELVLWEQNLSPAFPRSLGQEIVYWRE